jgi:hypothetical protein
LVLAIVTISASEQLAPGIETLDDDGTEPEEDHQVGGFELYLTRP